METLIQNIAEALAKNEDPNYEQYNYFLHQPNLSLKLIEHIDALDENILNENPSYFAACEFALDVCVAQLQINTESGSKVAQKILDELMSVLTKTISSKKHSLSFWLPILNAFYEVHVELSNELKNAYLDLANSEGDTSPVAETDHLESIRDLILELSDLSSFDIAENFFAQTYALPADFFADLVLDLYGIPEGKEIALLMLLNPKPEVRDVVILTLEHLLPHLILTPVSLSRLNVIKNWYPEHYQHYFNNWIKQQRKKGVVFETLNPSPIVHIKASEIDGSGAQGIFIHLQKDGKNRLCGLLFKQDTGIRDAWITPEITLKDIKYYYREAFDGCIHLREVDTSYLLMVTNHFLAVTLARGNVPDLHFLEIQEEIGLNFSPVKINTEELIEQIAIQISPFTPVTMEKSLNRSKNWAKTKSFASSWFVESPEIDKLVNQFCTFIDNAKVCKVEDAAEYVFLSLEKHRNEWLFHFLWISLWLKAKARDTETAWIDAFFVAYAVQTGVPLNDIPIMHSICHRSILNSIETMEERRTHLN